MSDIESKKASELSGNSQDQLLPFPSTRPDSELIGNSKSSDDSSIKPNTGAKTALPRRSRAGTMPSSYNASPLVYIPPNRGGGQGPAYQGQRSAELHGASQNSPAHILRARGATLSGSSINTGFGSNMLTSWRDIRSPLSSKPLVSLDESEQSIARTLDCLGLDDIETSRLPPQPQGVSALRNANRVRSRTFTAALHYAESPVNAVPAPPAQKRTVYPKSYNRARAISMGFLDPTDSIPELDAIMGEDDAYDFFDAYEHDEEGYSPSRALWIGNLDPAFGSADLMALFAPYGPIESLRVIPEKECAFINFMYLEDAVVAKADLSGGTIGNNVIRIGFSRVDSALGEMQASAPTRALWIGNISASTSSAMLQTIFSNFGAVESARVLSHKNCGFVNFERTEDAVKARKAMNGQEISGSVVRIGFAKVPPRGESGSKSTRTIPAVPLSVLGIPSAPWSSEDAPEPEEVKAASPTTVSPTVRFAPELNGVDTELSIIDKGLLLSLDDKLLAFPYASYLPPLPDSSHIKLDQNRLREIRKRLDSHPNPKDIENAFNELEPVFVELCTDYIGNTVIQKLMDKGNEAQRLRLIEKVAPFLAPIGVHKNGTWAVQKIIDSATTPAQIHHIINYLKPFVPPLMLDQFGNYVIQGCLKYGPEYNQFIYDAIHSRCWEICQGRFGARAVRTCLESNFVTKRQQRLVSVALAHSSLLLSTDPNGSLLLTWLLDTSNIYGRFKALVPQFSLHLPQLCTHKLATLTILKIINQRFEPDARSELIKSLFFSSDSVLEIVLGDQAHGMGLIQKILASACIEEDEREKIVERVREAAIKLELNQIQGYHHFMEQLGVPTSPNAINWQSSLPSANNGTSPDSPRIDQQQQA